jgi:hypothetical protein
MTQRIELPAALECAAASSGIDYGGIKYKAEQDRSCAALCRTTSIRGTDSLLERSEFELPVAVSKLSDDNVVL